MVSPQDCGTQTRVDNNGFEAVASTAAGQVRSRRATAQRAARKLRAGKTNLNVTPLIKPNLNARLPVVFRPLSVRPLRADSKFFHVQRCSESPLNMFYRCSVGAQACTYDHSAGRERPENMADAASTAQEAASGRRVQL